MSQQVTITRAQFLQIRKMGLFDESVIAKCLTEEKAGTYDDINGNKVTRLTIIKPSDSGNAVPMSEYLKAVSGTAKDKAEDKAESASA